MAPDPDKHIIVKLDGSDEVKAFYVAGQPAAAVLKAVATKLKSDGSLRMEDGPDVAGGEEKLDPGYYIYTPLEAITSTSGAHDEQPEWHKRFVMEKLDPLTASILRELSATRSASKAQSSDVDQLYQALRLRVTPFEGDPTWEQVMALHVGGGEPSAFWDERPEPAQRAEYIKILEEKIAFARKILEIRDARSTVLKFKFKNAVFPISSSNDTTVNLRSWHNVFDSGTVAGMELKKKLRPSQINQTRMAFLAWAQQSQFPIVQFLTDFAVGGAAYYYSGRGEDGWHNITFRLFKGMDAFWDFFKKVATTAADTCGTRIEPPASGEFPNPKRIKLYLSPGIKEDEVGEFVESYFDKDVANLDDLACFELQSLMSPEVLGYYG